MSLELDTLLNPISEHATFGEDLSFSNEFHDIKKAKTKDDPLLELGDWVAEPRQANWAFVADTSSKLLTEKTKDIRLLIWISEAWSNLYGFTGIWKSLELSHRMLDLYWLGIHPEMDDGDLDQRLGLLQGLVNQLPILLKNVPIVSAQPFYSLFDYESFLHKQNNRLKHADDNEPSDGSVLEQFDQALLSTSKTIQYQNYQEFSQVITHWETLKEVLDRLMELDGPSYANVDSQLQHIQKTLRKIYKADAFDQQINATQQTETNNATSAHENVTSTQEIVAPIMTTHSQQSFQPAPQSHLQNREQAMQVLQEIADYFQANEPHSPVSYMLQKTIKWSQMPLHEWLAQVIKNDNPLEAVHELLGVQQNRQESNDW